MVSSGKQWYSSTMALSLLHYFFLGFDLVSCPPLKGFSGSSRMEVYGSHMLMFLLFY